MTPNVPHSTFIDGLATWELEHVAEVNSIEEQAKAPEAAASELRWKQAERVVAALDAGMTQQRLADNWKKPDGSAYSKMHVSYVAKTWRVFGKLKFTDRPKWNEAYNSDEVRGGTTKSKAHVSQNSGENEWYTPTHIIDVAREVMGAIDLDPASSYEANKTVQAEAIYTQDDNGLTKPWHGAVWLNPPYASDLVGKFCDKLIEEYIADRVEQACFLSNNATETKWFQRLARVSSAICFPEGRISYWHPDRTSKTPLQGQAILYLGGNVTAFRSGFASVGVVMRP